jgi:hypothetical protein
MFVRARACAVALVAFLSVGPAPAAAQTGDTPAPVPARVLVGGELSGILGPADAIAFFNYTDYEHNALRLARMRLYAEWRVSPIVSFIGEVRTEDTDSIEASAAYVRVRPWAQHAIAIQAGRIPPVIGAFSRRAYGRENPLIGLPLAYQYLTSLRPDAVPATADDLLRMRARGWRPEFPIGSADIGPGMPLVSASRWSTGVEVRWQRDRFEAAGAYSLGPPGMPAAVDFTAGRQISGRAAVTIPAGATVGISAARGRWIDEDVLALLPADRRNQSAQTTIGVDAEAGGGPWLLRAEWLRTSYELPWDTAASGREDVSAWSAFVEVRRRLHARWQVALRLDRLAFSPVAGSAGVPTPWDAPIDRAEAAVAFRATRRLELRGGWQHNWREAGRVRERGFPAVQALFWF